ncbi:pentapeptide repeat-containing protein [Psychroserpens algicola]|uniref:Pentapeptide repeat-containing protein n=1 Tax=Psychroserpens algicola TaxID=1719034 RepID=A0ABT0H5H3_9FLAO|nr:pentapeptide repeat-containing protein [Psychroserpens algicola]MCK8479047.1 pentapeptide repeat-containing protein [Psychroserpens algicola]
MANREYSKGERDELLMSLREAFEECYKNSEHRHLSVGKSSLDLKSDFFRRLDFDSSKKNIEQKFTISRSAMESFFMDKTKLIFSDKNSVKINALIKFYDENIFDSENNQFISKDSGNESSVIDIENKSVSVKTEKVFIQANEIKPKEEVKESLDSKKSPLAQELNTNYKRLIIIPILLFFGYIAFNIYSENKDIELNELKKRNLIENSKIKSTSRSLELTNLINEIHKELKEDYLNDKKRNLSHELISRIVSLSEKFNPYLYLRDNKVIKAPLSRERAELFINLIDLNLDYKTYDKLFQKVNFSHSDFSKLDLSNYNLSNLMTGISGGSDGDVQILITTTKRPNMSYSNFDDTILFNCDLYGDFTGSDFTKALIKETVFRFSKLSNSNFSGNKLAMISFSSDFTNCNFKNSDIQGNFYYTDLRGSVFDGSSISSAQDYNNLNEEKVHLDNIFKYRGYSPTFYDVFLSSDDLIFDYNIEIKKVDDPEANFSKFRVNLFAEEIEERGSESGLIILKTLHKVSKNTSSSNDIVVAALRKKEKKDTILFGVDFDSESEKFDHDYFMTIWKDNPDNFYSYIIRTNDHYRNNPIHFYPGEPYLDHEYEEIDYKLDTLHNFSGKDFHFITNKSLNKQEWYLCEQYKKKSKYNSASFRNCTFNKVHFYSKISNVSFMESTFNEVKFDYSLLYNVNFKKVKGEIYLNESIKFDSLLVDQDFKWLTYSKKTDSIQNQQFLINGELVTLKQFIFQKNIDSLSRFDVGNERLWNSIQKLKFIREVGKRVSVEKKSNSFMLRDSLFVKRYNELKKLSLKNKDRIIPYH